MLGSECLLHEATIEYSSKTDSYNRYKYKLLSFEQRLSTTITKDHPSHHSLKKNMVHKKKVLSLIKDFETKYHYNLQVYRPMKKIFIEHNDDVYLICFHQRSNRIMNKRKGPRVLLRVKICG